MSVAELDTVKQEAFAGRMVQVLNDACLCLMAGLGHESGLFDTMAGLAPATSEEVARAAGLNERYVREWLGAMVVGGLVDGEAGFSRVETQRVEGDILNVCYVARR